MRVSRKAADERLIGDGATQKRKPTGTQRGSLDRDRINFTRRRAACSCNVDLDILRSEASALPFYFSARGHLPPILISNDGDIKAAMLRELS